MGNSSTQKAKNKNHLRNLLLVAINDKEPYSKYINIRNVLVRYLETKEKKIELFIVSFIKSTIKSPVQKGYQKFNALLLLKDLMKANNHSFIKILSKIFLRDLYSYASSRDKERCLMQSSSRVSYDYSSKFYHLLLECFKFWKRNQFISEKYFVFYKRLKQMKRISEEDQYIDYPDNLQSVSNILEEIREDLVE